jgi:hypothetical protein
MPTTEAQVRAYLEPEEPNYQAAAAALGAEALPVLESLIQSAEPLLASKAAYLASMIPGEQAARALEQAARSDHPTVRVAAAAGMRKRPDLSDDVANSLIADPDQGVRKVAAKAARGRSRSAVPGTAPEHPAGGRTSEDEHGGGPSPDTRPGAESSAGEGGGEVGDARHGSASRATVTDSDSGGGGSVTGSEGARAGRSPDGPDGGGSSGSAAHGDADVSDHGGGRI